jgi:hypothetical protein
MSLVEIPREIIQSEVAKSLEVSKRLYDILVERFTVLINQSIRIPAGSPLTVLLNWKAPAELDGFLVKIVLRCRVNNATGRFSIVPSYHENDTSKGFDEAVSNTAKEYHTVLKEGDQIIFYVDTISATSPATGSVFIAIGKVLPTS